MRTNRLYSLLVVVILKIFILVITVDKVGKNLFGVYVNQSKLFSPTFISRVTDSILEGVTE